MNTNLSTDIKNPFVGTWRIVSADLERNGESQPAFGRRPIGFLTFTKDMHFVEVLMDADTPHFANGDIGQGTDEENRAVVAKTIGISGSYEVSTTGEFLGDPVEVCTFPNWIGDVRTQKEIIAKIKGSRLSEEFHQPAGAVIRLVWQRVD